MRDMVSMALTPAEQQMFTNAWRDAISYGKGTRSAFKAQIEAEAREIYKSYPTILKELGLK